LSDVANGIDVTVESLGDVMISLMRAIGSDLEQDVSVFNFIGGSFTRAGEFNQLLTFFVVESDNILFIHVDPPSFMRCLREIWTYFGNC
jgi:hypothetical protein